MSDEPAPFTPYQCSLGTVLDHGETGTIYRVQLPDGTVRAVEANGTPSPEAVEYDIENPPVQLATAADIKAEAGRRILLIAPSWKQSNMIARVLELTNAHGSDPATWPTEAQAERATYDALWQSIKAIRAHSDALEAAPPPLADLPNAGWPA